MSAPLILCPRCKSPNIALVEEATTYLKHYPNDVDGYQEPGEINKVVLECHACRHSHTLRGVPCMNEELEDRLRANNELIKAQTASNA
jgi:uncharacterized protein YbaR (Trm112 family)